MRIASRLVAIVFLGFATLVAWADSSIKLTTFPTMSVADGRSTVTITAEIRDQNGKTVPDGTHVQFDTNKGTWREASALTIGGFARGVLVAPGEGEAGIATITATALGVAAAPTTVTYEFVASRDDLASAKEYIEVVAPGYMQYVPKPSEILGAAAPNQGVFLRYRNITINADDMQLDFGEIPQDYVVRARKAKLKIGKFEKDFDELYFKLKLKEGYGTTTFKAKRPNSVVALGTGLAFVKEAADGKVSYAADEDHYGFAKVFATQVIPSGEKLASYFIFKDLSKAPSFISARKAIIFPKKKIQFQRAQIYIAGSKVFTMPMMEYSLVTATPLVTEQMLGIVDSQLEVNYPFILSMQPGETSLLRFRTGDQYGRGETVDSGAFLDYELSWDHGDDMQGGFLFQGIGRKDWDVGFNQYIRLDDRTSASVQLLSPAGTAFFGSGMASHQFNGFSVNVNGDAARTLQGIQYTTQDYAATIAKDPIKMGTLPVKLFLELTTTTSSNQLLNETQSGAGARARFQSSAIPVIDRDTTWTSTLTTSYLSGENELKGPQVVASTSLGHRFSMGTSATLTYNFTRDGFNEYVIGEHSMTLQTNMSLGHINITTTGSKSLDIQRSTLFTDVGYKLSNLWRLTSGYTYDNYLDTTFIDYNFGFGYKLGWREVGLIWSEQTRRIGLQLLGSTTF